MEKVNFSGIKFKFADGDSDKPILKWRGFTDDFGDYGGYITLPKETLSDPYALLDAVNILLHQAFWTLGGISKDIEEKEVTRERAETCKENLQAADLNNSSYGEPSGNSGQLIRDLKSPGYLVLSIRHALAEGYLEYVKECEERGADLRAAWSVESISFWLHKKGLLNFTAVKEYADKRKK